MITQQAASFLIKKMTTATANRSKFGPKDRTDELFAWYLNGTKPYVKIVHGTNISNESIVTAFRWRAAELVRPKPKIIFEYCHSKPRIELPGFQS
jgi:hypothetical protein